MYEYVDENGVRRFTSDPTAAAERWSGVRPALPDDETALERDAREVAASLEQYLLAYGGTSTKVALSLELEAAVEPLDTPRPDDLRRVIHRAELHAVIDPAPDSTASSLRERLATVLFPPLRSVYPNAHLVVTMHDGLHTICRADWAPEQEEPTTTVK